MSASSYADRPRVDRHENVTRYAGGSHYDATTGEVNGSAFDREAKDADGLSVNRVGVLSRDKDEDRASTRRVLATRRTLGRTAIFVELNVGAALEALAEFEEDIFMCHDALEKEGDKAANPAHALVIGLPFKGEAVGSLKSELAGDRLRGVVCDTFPVIVPLAASDA